MMTYTLKKSWKKKIKGNNKPSGETQHITLLASLTRPLKTHYKA
jgi:hypothetical protein